LRRCKKAVAAGAESQMPPSDMFYGDRSGSVKDPAGNMWWIATHKEVLTTEEIQKRANVFFTEKAKQKC
jgi:PhnB protein